MTDKAKNDALTMFSDWKCSTASVYEELKNEYHDVIIKVLTNDTYKKDIVDILTMSVHDYFVESICNKYNFIEGLQDINKEPFILVDIEKLNALMGD